ncbi:MAG TPA: di-heme-cytochrome C peroxidase [Kofleriaceae bacterium]|nr:di-heme-cytochrome C peroxidase [Kofleriaceae bacterium]
MSTSKRVVALALVFTSAAATATGCIVGDPEEGLEEESALILTTQQVFLDQGWDSATRAKFYQTSQGSRFMPYKWFINLEQANNKTKFIAADNFERMGFLVDPPSPTNPDGLPIGFAKDTTPTGGDAVGITCAACHTGELEFGRYAVRIDGGQSFADIEQFQDGLLAAMNATLADSGKFKRFGDKVLGSNASTASRNELRTQLTAKRDWWNARITRSRGASPHGPSRTDAFTIIGNEVVCDLFRIPENCAQPNAPTQYPFLWNTPDFEWAQYNSSVHSPLGRNVGEVTGVFAEATIDANGVASTAHIPNLHLLENWLKTLRAPAWPENIFGRIDENLALQGAQLFADNCASCHTEDPQPRTAPNAFGKTFAKTNFDTPLSALGTDPNAALSFATRRANPGPFTAIAQANGLIGPDGKAPVAALLSISGSMIIQRYFAVAGFTDAQKLDYLDFRESRSPSTAQLTTYRARPLNGVAFTAPYLHNGSVQSLYQLLLPPELRLKLFFVGSRRFDPFFLGYSPLPAPGAVLLDTTKTGNSNAGHNYGTNFTHFQRMAVIEYIKTL